MNLGASGRFRAVYLVIVVFAGTTLSASGRSPEQLSAYIKRCRATLPKAIEQLQDHVKKRRRDLAQAKRGRINRGQQGTKIDSSSGRISFPDKQTRLDHIAKIESQLQVSEETIVDMQQGHKVPFLCISNKEDPAVGQLGRLPHQHVEITQVTGPMDMLVQVTWHSRFPRNPDLRFAFWVHGVPTSGFADDSRQWLNQVFFIARTKTYESVTGGSETVLVIEPVDMSEVLKPEVRTWHSLDGDFSTEAEFVAATGSTVTLKKSNGSVIIISLKKLSTADRRWIAQRTGKGRD